MVDPIKLFSGPAVPELSEKIAERHGTTLGKCKIERFSDGEFEAYYEESLRGTSVYIIQSTFPPSEHIFELAMMIDAAKRASAHRVVAVIPYFGFARGDRKSKPRCSIAAKLIANLLTTAGVDRIITMDLHADQIQAFFDIPVDHLSATPIFIPYIKTLKLKNVVVASPDVGGVKRAHSFAQHIKGEMVTCYKFRKKANEVSEIKLMGDVNGKDVIIYDDMVDTCGTLCAASDLIKDMGAKSVRGVSTHAVLSGSAYDKIRKCALDELIVTDTIPLKEEHEKIKVLTVADLFADVINKVHTYRSISGNFI